PLQDALPILPATVLAMATSRPKCASDTPTLASAPPTCTSSCGTCSSSWRPGAPIRSSSSPKQTTRLIRCPRCLRRHTAGARAWWGRAPRAALDYRCHCSGAAPVVHPPMPWRSLSRKRLRDITDLLRCKMLDPEGAVNVRPDQRCHRVATANVPDLWERERP